MNQKEFLKQIVDWFNEPITKLYIKALEKEAKLSEELAYRSSHEAILSGKIDRRTEQELVAHQILARNNQILKLLLDPYDASTTQEELTKEDISKLEEFSQFIR